MEFVNSLKYSGSSSSEDEGPQAGEVKIGVGAGVSEKFEGARHMNFDVRCVQTGVKRELY